MQAEAGWAGLGPYPSGARDRSTDDVRAHAANAIKFVIVLAASSAVVGSTAATGSAGSDPMAARLTAPARSIAGWCCGDVEVASGHAVVPGIGPVAFASRYVSGVNPYLTFDQQGGYVRPYSESRSLSLTLQAANGDVVVLVGKTTWSQAHPAPPLAWHITRTTGQFAGLTGTGTYAYAREGTNVTLSLHGATRH